MQIKSKEERSKQEAGEEEGIGSDKKSLRGVAEVLRLSYQERKVSNMFLVQIVDRVQRNPNSPFKSKEEIKEAIMILVQRFPSWLSLHSNPAGDIIRLDRAHPFQNVVKFLNN